MATDLNFFDTFIGKVTKFEPINSNNIGMYVCGPTVYDSPHIGNARPIVIYDILFRLLTKIYGKVTYVRNITDIDDKIINEAAKRKITIDQLTSEVTQTFHDNIAQLNALPPTIEPKATDHIVEMVEMIQALLDNDMAYKADNHVYFDITKDPNYGKLAGRKIEELQHGKRIEVSDSKRNPGDFVLWKPVKNEQEDSCYESPFGKGRPGWHIECSAMSTKYLGVDFDIHGGGADLMFPHHTNEIAQSCCANKNSGFAKYWIHNGFVTVGGEKMSKSLGNFTTISDLLKKVKDGEVIRYMLISAHYRKPLDCNDKAIKDAEKSLNSFYRAIQLSQPTEEEPPLEFLEALKDDLNTPLALSIIHDLTNQLNKEKDKAKASKFAGQLKSCGDLLGILQRDANNWFKNIDQDLKNFVESKILERQQAKKDKDFAKADSLRDELKAKNIILLDKPKGITDWYLDE